MEQLLTAFGINGKLLLAQLINFGVLFVGLSYLLYKPVMKVLDERTKKIELGVQAAEEAMKKASRADEEASTVVKGAETQAEGIVAGARETALVERTRIIKEAEARASSVEKDAEARALEDSARMLRESEKEIARLSILAAEKVLRQGKTTA